MSTAVQTQTIELPIGRRYATIAPSPTVGESIPIVDPDTRTCWISFSSELPQPRWDWEIWDEYNEVLSHDPTAANLERCNSGVCPLLWNHDRDDQRGVIVQAEIRDDQRAHALVRFSRSEAGEQLMQDVNDRIITGVSFAYRIYEMVLSKIAEPPALNTYTATDWEVMEISFCSVPADPTVGAARSDPDTNSVIVQGAPMPTAKTPRTRKAATKPRAAKPTRQKANGLTLAEAMTETAQEEGAGALFCAFQDVMDDIDDAEGDVDKTALMQQAIADLGTQLSQIYSTPAAQPPEPIDEEENTMPEIEAERSDRPIENLSAKLQLEQEQQRSQDLEKRLAALEQERELGSKCSRQQRRAELLRAAGKLSPAMCKALFGTDDDTPVEVYRSHQGKDPVEFLLDVLENHGSQLVDFKSYLGNTPLPNPPQEPAGEPGAKASDIYARLKNQGAFNRTP